MPFFPRKRRNYRKRSTVPKKRTYKKRSIVSNTIKRYVKRTIHSNIENKTEQTLSSSNVVTSYAVNSSLFVVSCIPYSGISQGLGAGDRIGNVIRTRKTMFNYCLRPNAYSASLNPNPTPQEVIIMFGKVKNSRAQQPISTDFSKLFQAGDSYHAPYSNLLDLLQDVNKDWFTVYKVVKHKIGNATYSTGATASQLFSNNDFKLNVVRRLNITKFMPKIVKFNDTTAQPTNDGLWMWAMCVNADGTASATQYPCYMDYTLNYEYEDA